MPCIIRVSQATLAFLSCVSIASRTASDIWSATLSGCPSATDSDVKRCFKRLLFNFLALLIITVSILKNDGFSVHV